jgi:uncharacterized protein (TIGR01244 family)
MKNEGQIDGITVAGQPTDEELRGLRERGFVMVINNRPADELNEPEAPKIPEGVQYVDVSFTSATLAPEHVARTRDALNAANGPVLVHCAGGTRAAVVVAAVQAEDTGEGLEGALRRIREAGFDVDGTPYGTFLQRYFE